MAPHPVESRDDESSNVVTAAAEFLVERSDRGWVRLLAEHADDGTGHCATCRGPAGSHWPCMLWTIARRAELLAQRRATRSARSV